MSEPNYYNEFDLYAAQYLRNLIDAGLIAPGVVDTRSIEDVRPSDLAGFKQCHFFAGIGIWSLALRRAGWPDDRPVWTGSCPCQPFSAAGKGAGFADERHLWPAFHHLIKECKPESILGEQVANKDADDWIDLVQADMEAMGYAVGAVPFPSASVGAPHIRDRLYWAAVGLADSGSTGLQERKRNRGIQREALESYARQAAECSGSISGMGHSKLPAQERQRQHCREVLPIEESEGFNLSSRVLSGLANTEGYGHEWPREFSEPAGRDGDAHGGAISWLGDTSGERRGEARPISAGHPQWPADASATDVPGPVNGIWRNADWIMCRDPDGPKWRPVEAGTFPLDHGNPGRVGMLRAFGNAINPEQARIFVECVMEAM